MPTRAQHLSQAAENERFAETVRDGPAQHIAWAVTAFFYSVVHYGRALLASQNVLVTSHQQFAALFLRTTQNHVLYQHYRWLKDESERGRYDCVSFTPADILTLEQQHFIPYRDALLRLLAATP
jgi:hypothetical protein